MVTDRFELLFLALFLQTVLEQTMYHLFSCIEKLFQAGDAGKSSKLPSERKKDHKKAANSCRQKLREPQTDPCSTSDGGKYCWKGTISHF